MGRRVAWIDQQEMAPRFLERIIDRAGLDHAVTHFADHAPFLKAHRVSPFDVAVLRTTAPTDPLNANAVVGLLRRESPRTVVALCSGCRVDPGPSDGTPCAGGIRVAHSADPDLFDRFLPKPMKIGEFRKFVDWLSALEDASLTNHP